jgi:catechol 2,3-dioxygenase-like lactoylglutathione lyase family enzyme
MEMRLVIVVLPVHEVDRAKRFYRSIGFHEELDYASGVAFRIVRFRPPGSATAIAFGEGITSAIPGSVQGLVLAVRDIAAAHADLRDRGVPVSDVFHDSGGVFYHLAPGFLAAGPDPTGRDRASFARFCDPDGNGWVIQEVREAATTPADPVDPADPGDPWSDPGDLRARGARRLRTLGAIRDQDGSRQRRSS